MFVTALALALAASIPAGVCNAETVYGPVRAAMGAKFASPPGGEMIVDGALRVSGLRGSFVSTTDLHDGRSSLLQRFGPFSIQKVYDGRVLWRRDYSGGVHPLDSPNARAAAVTQAYLDRFGYLAPNAGGASVACLPSQTEGARSFSVVRLQPRRGLPVEQWIDASTSLIDRTIGQTPTETRVLWQSDYRQTGDAVLPFTLRRSTIGDPSSDEVSYVRSYRFVPSVAVSTFVRPADPSDTRIVGNAASATVPVSIEAGDVVVMARINGKGPFPFILDTGGHAILTPEAAREIGLTTAGSGSSGGAGSGRVALSYTLARSIQIGNAVVPNQPFLVIPYGNDFSDRGSRRPIAGILGLELFERFAITVDYGHARLTMAPLRTYSHRGGATPLAIVFQDDMPITRAAADDRSGWFGVDTGNSGTPVLFGPFLTRFGLLEKYKLGTSTIGYGTGGAVHSFRQQLHSLTFAGRRFANVPVFFVVGQKGGSFSSTTEAGNLGYQTLGHFTPTFDYRDATIYVAAGSQPPAPPFGRAGLGLIKPQRDRLVAVVVVPKSPAAEAGIALDDTIVSIDGIPARDLGGADIYRLMRQPIGTTVTLDVVHNGTRRRVTLRLRDVFAE